jgi:hypothetical protein
MRFIKSRSRLKDDFLTYFADRRTLFFGKKITFFPLKCLLKIEELVSLN